MRFTVDGSKALEDQIAEDMIAIRDAVLARIDEQDLSALILGGGYGRGEGGVFVKDGKERVYNDYDFFVIVPSNSRRRHSRLAKALAEVKAATEPLCGIHVDFSPAMPRSSLASLPYELMFMELKAGHHVVIGPEDILANLPPYDTTRPPLEECTRLFMNRGVGLLLARQKLEKVEALGEEELEFVVRNIRKAQLAMGDALMFLQGCYSPSYLKRHEQFRRIELGTAPGQEKLCEYYEEALAFKLRPNHSVPHEKTLQLWHDEITQLFGDVFLWFEQHRLEDTELTWSSYKQRARRLPSRGAIESAKNLVRNLNIKTAELPTVEHLLLHPRDRVLGYLPSLLFDSRESKCISDDILSLWEHCG